MVLPQKTLKHLRLLMEITKLKKIAIFGAGGFGKEVACIINKINEIKQTWELIGFFVNTLALRTQIDEEAPFTDLLQKVKATTLEAYEHQEVPFEKVVEEVVKELVLP